MGPTDVLVIAGLADTLKTLTGEEIKRVMRGDPPQPGADEDDKTDVGNAPSVTAIPKTKPKAKPAADAQQGELF